MKQGIKRFLIVLSVLILTVTFAGCKKDPAPTPDPELTVQAISEVLTNQTADSNVMVKGTIYYVVNNGFYLSDSELGKIFVQTGKTFTDPIGIAVGKEVELKGVFKVSSDRPYIDTVTELKLVSENGTLPTAVPSTVANIVAKDKASKTGSWYGYVELKGKVVVDEATSVTKFIDDAGDEISFTTVSNLDALKSKGNERVTIKVVVSEFATFGSVWKVTFVGSADDVLVSPFTLAEVRAMVEPWLTNQIPSEIKGSLTLPALYDRIDNLLVTWSSTIPADIEVLALEEGATTYRTNISLPDQDTPGVLTATVKYREEAPFTLDFDVTVKELVATSLKEALESSDSMIMFEAVVVGFSESQTNSYNALIVQDLTNPGVTITVDYHRVTPGDYGLLTLANPKIGDVVIIGGTHRTSQGGDRPSVVDPIVTATTGATQTPVYDFENAYELKDEASWKAFPGFNTLVKLNNPYMRYSTSSMPGPENWIRLGYDIDNVSTKYGPSNNKALAFVIRSIDNLMTTDWRINLGITTTADDPIMFDGAIYGYLTYESTTYIVFTAVSAEHFVASSRLQAVTAVKESVPTRHEEGNIDLLTTHAAVTGDIVWASSHVDIVSPEGVVTFPQLDTVVTLTATFTVNGEEIVLTQEVLVVGQIKVVLQVDEVLTNSVDGDMFNVEGIVLGGGYNTAAGLSDIFLQDKTSGNVIIVQSLTNLGTDFNIGDLIEFSGKLEVSSSDNESGKKQITYDTNLTVVEANFGILNYRDTAIVVDSNDKAIEMLNAENLSFGSVYFFTGNYFINGTKSAYSDNANLRFHLNDAASGTSDIKYGVGKNLVLNIPGNETVLGSNWHESILGFNADNYPGTGYPGRSFVGGFYAVLKNASNSYYYWSILSEDDFVFETTQQRIDRELEELVPENMTGGDLVLPTTHALATGEITWTSDNPAVISNAGVVTYGESDVVVKLTATYVFDGVDHEVEVLVNVLALKVQTVAEVIAEATEGEIVKVKGIVVGFHWNGSSTLGLNTHGLIIKDAAGNELLYVVGLHDNYGNEYAKYTVGEGETAHTLALGDEVEFSAEYGVSAVVGNADRKTLTISSAAAANLQVKNTGVTYTFDTSSPVVIKSETDLDTLAENLAYGVLYKLEGPFTLRSSSKKLSGANMIVGFGTGTALVDYDHAASWADVPQRFTFKVDGNGPHLGNDWGETKLGLIGTLFTGNNPYFFDATSEIYFYVGNTNQMSEYGYIQLVILDSTHVNATLVPGA